MENKFKYLTAKLMKRVAREGDYLSLERRIAPWVIPLLKRRRISIIAIRLPAEIRNQQETVSEPPSQPEGVARRGTTKASCQAKSFLGGRYCARRQAGGRVCNG